MCAETHNFSEESQLKQFEKIQQKETNRLIGFLKTQDKNLLQTKQNLISVMEDIHAENAHEFLKLGNKK